MSTPYEAQEWKNDIDAFKAEYGLRGGSVGTPYEIKPWMNEIDALRAEIEEGGGSSDFSIAHVTLIETGGGRQGRQSTAIETVLIEDNDNFIFGEARADNGETIVANVVLYKGRSILTFVSYGTVQEITGDIEESGNGYIITGDCTIRAIGDKDV